MYGTPSPISSKKVTSKLYCEEHPSEKLTNFCFTSLKALCPSCIDTHNKLMRQQNLFPEVDTLRNVKNNSGKKVTNAVIALKNELARLEDPLQINPKEIIDEGITIIRKGKTKIFEIFEKYFDDVEFEYVKKINETVKKLNGGGDISDKLRTLLSELDYLLCGIESPNSIETVRKICMIDTKALLEKFKRDVDSNLGLRQNMMHNFSEIKVDDGMIPRIHENLYKYLSLIHKDEEGTKKSANNNTKQTWDQQKFDNHSQNNTSHNAYDIKPPEEEEDKYGLLQFHKMFHNNASIKFPINLVDYFEQGCQRKYLHFFQNHENRLHYIDLDKFISTQKANFEAIELNINFRIPPFHKSISIPNGDIYLVGGSDPVNNNKKHSTNYFFDFHKRTLISRASMNTARSSFAICYMNRSIYAVGGLTNNSGFTSTCERYDILQNRWSPIADLNFDVLAPCVATFNNKFIFKFGGNSADNKLENRVEKYDPVKNKWYPLQPKIDIPYNIKSNYFKMLNTSAAIQISLNEIYIFGGYLDDNTGSNSTFVFRINAEEDDKNPYTVTEIGSKTLTHAEAFWNNNPIIMNKNIFALQNVQTSDQEDVCLDDRRRLLLFNSIEWKNVLST